MFRAVAVVLSSSGLILGASGCGQAAGGAPAPVAPAVSAAPFSWNSVGDCTMSVVRWLNDGTNWVLNKNQVSVSKISGVERDEAGSSYLADFKIVVINGASTFDAVVEDVDCDELGIPTDKSVDKLRGAVEDIKAKIKRIQN